MNDLEAFRDTFFDECTELLGELDQQFAAIAAGDRSAGRLNAVFRAIHSIKGGAGAFGLSGLVEFTHAFETLLDHLREGRIVADGELLRLCIRATDTVADFVAAGRSGIALDADFGSGERRRFATFCDTAERATVPRSERADVATPEPGVPAETDLDSFEVSPLDVEMRQFVIAFRPHVALYARANDPLLLLRELGSLGDASVQAQLEALPDLTRFEPFGVYCQWQITLVSGTATTASIREVFEFVEGDCELAISQVSGPEEHSPQAAEGDEGADRDQLFATGEQPQPSDFAAEPEAAGAAVAGGGEEIMPIAPGAAAATPSAEATEPAAAGAARAGMHSIRVDLDKVDRVVNMVGELVITQSMLTQQLDDTLRSRHPELVRGLEVLAQTTRGLQDAVMAIRAQPIRSVFSRMPRVLRDLAGSTGKQMRLEIVGENTEIDKTVIEQLADPLTHMLRNAADHGIEPPATRRAQGKPECGTVRISAAQAGGSVVITVEDDGAGIDRQRVLAIARQRGLVAHGTTPGDEAIDNLVFVPGFSTAAKVSDISGRGVGMDVVMANINSLGGSVQIRSWPGRGTRVTLRLPLTLAVLDVMQVTVGGSPYLIPLSSIIETLQVKGGELGRVPSGAPVLQLHGEYVGVVDLAAAFELPDSPSAIRYAIVCETEATQRLALLVDDIAGQQQVVIKSIEENFERIDGIAGGTILGNGAVALIIDVAGLQPTVARRRAA